MKGSLSHSLNFIIQDLPSLGLVTPFIPENIELGEYTFLPYVRTGLAAGLVAPTAQGIRASVPVSVDVRDEAGGAETVTRVVTLRGPGDVVGIEAAQVVRREPTPNAQHVEETFLAHIEFDRPELPWLFTPAVPQANRLRPWLVLVVLDADAAVIEAGAAELPSRLRTVLGQLPSLDGSWAWAHAQVVGGLGGAPTLADRLSESHAPTNLSRIICPRRLSDGRSYVAALVPAYDAGVQAGLGLPGGTLAPAWTRAADGSDAGSPVVLPVYDSWRFSTAAKGDFESLAKKIEGIPAPWSVGRRIIDASHPRGGMQRLGGGEQGTLQVLKCALYSPATPPSTAPPEGTDWAAPRRDALRQLLNAPAQAAEAQDLPHVGPRIYARWQRAAARIDGMSDSDWFEHMNTSPVHRLVAGLGTRVVRKDQEQLMQAAWAQVGEIDAANALLARIQFARFVADALHRNHFQKLGIGELAQLTRGVQDKVRLGGAALTVQGTVRASATPTAALTPAFRRAVRVRGPIARAVRDPALLRNLVAVGETFRDLRYQYREPDGVGSLSPGAIAAFPVELLARKLAVAPQLAVQKLTDQVAAVRADLTVADRVLRPVADWRV
jgi:hypothetical protein